MAKLIGRCYDKAGNPITWAAVMAVRYDRDGRISDYARIGEDTVGETRVSTVWMGLDHQFGDGPPLIFETMCLGGDHDAECFRYATEQEAIEGHRRMVELLRATP